MTEILKSYELCNLPLSTFSLSDKRPCKTVVCSRLLDILIKSFQTWVMQYFNKKSCMRWGVKIFYMAVWYMEYSDFLIFSISVAHFDCSLNTFNIFRPSACWRLSRTYMAFNRLKAKSEASVLKSYLVFTHCIPSENLNYLNCFHIQISRFEAKLTIYLQWMWWSIHKFTHWHLSNPVCRYVVKSPWLVAKLH